MCATAPFRCRFNLSPCTKLNTPNLHVTNDRVCPVTRPRPALRNRQATSSFEEPKGWCRSYPCYSRGEPRYWRAPTFNSSLSGALRQVVSRADILLTPLCPPCHYDEVFLSIKGIVVCPVSSWRFTAYGLIPVESGLERALAPGQCR